MNNKKNLRKELTEKAVVLLTTGERNLKAFEIGFQETIEELNIGRCWWQVTSCNIFNELLTTQDPFKVVDLICDNLKGAN